MKTRFATYHKMLQSIINKWEPMVAVLDRRSRDELLRFSKDNVSDITELTKEFDDAITFLECENFARMHTVLPILHRLICEVFHSSNCRERELTSTYQKF